MLNLLRDSNMLARGSLGWKTACTKHPIESGCLRVVELNGGGIDVDIAPRHMV